MTEIKNLSQGTFAWARLSSIRRILALYVIACRHTYPFARVDLCEHGDEPSGSVKCGEFDSFLPKKDLVD